jgi:hypothetical protein
MKNEKWKMENGKWKMETELWKRLTETELLNDRVHDHDHGQEIALKCLLFQI